MLPTFTFIARRREIERSLTAAIRNAEHAAAETAAANRRAELLEIDRQGLLDLHQPVAVDQGDLRVPLLLCACGTESWPCDTIQYVYRFGEFAPS